MNDGSYWGGLLVIWLLGAPLVGAVISVMIDGTRRRSPTFTHDHGQQLREPMPAPR